MPSKAFFFCSNLRFGGRQSTVTMIFTCWPREHSFPISGAVGGTCRRLSHFCNILLQELQTLLHVKITRSTNLLSLWRRKLRLPTYLHTVSYKYISFLNTCSQLAWVLASSEYYSITWRIVSVDLQVTKFIFKNSLDSEETFSPYWCDIFLFFEFLPLGNLSTAPVFSFNQINKHIYTNYRECFVYFTQLAETMLF